MSYSTRNTTPPSAKASSPVRAVYADPTDLCGSEYLPDDRIGEHLVLWPESSMTHCSCHTTEALAVQLG